MGEEQDQQDQDVVHVGHQGNQKIEKCYQYRTLNFSWATDFSYSYFVTGRCETAGVIFENKAVNWLVHNETDGVQNMEII